uniref:G-protein coupled receptors family 3 profile domain-containing protein n=1 Tax=Fibrocapsa japonica TaxID=94617 RepID=A0A7S2UXD3_9STRA
MAAVQRGEDVHDLNIVIPDQVATSSLVYPMPSFEYRSCIETHGQGSCLCSEEGCPVCTINDYDFSVGQCGSSVERFIEYCKSPQSSCSKGVSTPDPIAIECDHVPSSSPVSTVVAAVCGLCSLPLMVCLVWIVCYGQQRFLRSSQPLFLVLFTLGGWLCALSPLSSFGLNTDSRCVGMQWRFHLSFTVMIGSLLVKVYRVWRIFGNVKLQKIKVTRQDSLKLLSCIVGAAFVLLLAWTTLEKPGAYSTVEEIPNVGNVNSLVCKREGTFRTVVIVYQVALVLVGCYLSFQNRHVSGDYAETTHIMASIYTIALISGITGIVASQDVALSLCVLVMGVGTALSSTLAVCILIFPKMIAHYYGMDVSRNQSVDGTVGGGKGHQGLAITVSPAPTPVLVTSSYSTPVPTNYEEQHIKRIRDLEEEVETLKAQLAVKHSIASPMS